eukprot:gene26925-4548_t
MFDQPFYKKHATAWKSWCKLQIRYCEFMEEVRTSNLNRPLTTVDVAQVYTMALRKRTMALLYAGDFRSLLEDAASVVTDATLEEMGKAQDQLVLDYTNKLGDFIRHRKRAIDCTPPGPSPSAVHHTDNPPPTLANMQAQQGLAQPVELQPIQQPLHANLPSHLPVHHTGDTVNSGRAQLPCNMPAAPQLMQTQLAPFAMQMPAWAPMMGMPSIQAQQGPAQLMQPQLAQDAMQASMMLQHMQHMHVQQMQQMQQMQQHMQMAENQQLKAQVEQLDRTLRRVHSTVIDSTFSSSHAAMLHGGMIQQQTQAILVSQRTSAVLHNQPPLHGPRVVAQSPPRQLTAMARHAALPSPPNATIEVGVLSNTMHITHIGRDSVHVVLCITLPEDPAFEESWVIPNGFFPPLTTFKVQQWSTWLGKALEAASFESILNDWDNGISIVNPGEGHTTIAPLRYLELAHVDIASNWRYANGCSKILGYMKGIVFALHMRVVGGRRLDDAADITHEPMELSAAKADLLVACKTDAAAIAKWGMSALAKKIRLLPMHGKPSDYQKGKEVQFALMY